MLISKAIIGVSAAALVVVGYVGASWGLGRAVHSGFDNWEQQLAKQPLPMLKLVERKYTPGVFSSAEEMTFEFNRELFDQLRKSSQPTPEQSAPMRFTVRNDVTHGPLPGFTGIGTGRIDTKLVWSKEVRAKLDEFLPGREPVEISTLVGLLGGLSSHVTSPAFEYQDEKSTVGWKGFEGDFSVGRNLGSMNCDATGPGLSAYDADGIGVKLETLKITCDAKRVFDALYAGTMNVEVAGIEARVKGDPAPMRLQKVSYLSDVRTDGEYVDVAVKAGIGAVNVTQYQFSDVKYHVSLRHLHGPTYAELTRKMQETWMSSIGGDPTASLALDGAFGEYGPKLLEHSPQLLIDHIGFSAPEGEFGIKGTAELVGFKKDDLATAQSRAELIAKIVANADVWVSEGLLNKDWSAPTQKTAVSNEEAASGPSKVEALRQQVAAFEQQGFITRKDGQVTTHIQFKGGSLTANGKPLK